MVVKKRGKKESNKKKSNKLVHPELTSGQKAADFITKWAGSWWFICGVFLFLFLWMALNVYFLISYGKKSFDPYPFILLNLILSCLAAIQAPIILMSQNRQQERDRIKAERDYVVNRRAEREVEKVVSSLDYIKNVLGEIKKKRK